MAADAPPAPMDIMDDESEAFELHVVVKKGSIFGGGLPHTAHVITTIGNDQLNQTEELAAPYFWNEHIVKKFSTLEPVVPVIISFCVYKKRWTAPGHKLVGTVQFPLSDLLGILNKGAVEKQFNLFANRRNLTMNGSLILSLELKEIEVATPAPVTEIEGPQLRDLRVDAVVRRWGEAAAKPNYIAHLALCFLDDLGAAWGQLSAYDNQHFGDNLKLLLLLLLGLFLLLNYHFWATSDLKLHDAAHRMAQVSHTMETLAAAHSR